MTKKKAVKACAVQHLQGKTSLEARLQRSAACRRTEEAQAAYIETYREDNEMSRALRHEAHDARDLLDRGKYYPAWVNKMAEGTYDPYRYLDRDIEEREAINDLLGHGREW